MFGYILLNADKLTEDEKRRYNEIYCGLCHSLGDLHGQISRMSLSYDMTFLALFLSALYEPSENKTDKACIVHPKKSKDFVQNKFTEYAADMTILLSYYKCLDDFNDNKNIIAKGGASLLKKKYDEVEKKYPWQCEHIKHYMNELSEIENRNGSADEAFNCFGKVLGVIFQYNDDIWGKSLYKFGENLGKFIYAMDACLDYDDDKRHKKYNPLIASDIGKDETEEILKVLIGNSSEIFEKLPIIQDENILRNIIYSGVWYKYNRKKKKEREKQNGR